MRSANSSSCNKSIEYLSSDKWSALTAKSILSLLSLNERSESWGSPPCITCDKQILIRNYWLTWYLQTSFETQLPSACCFQINLKPRREHQQRPGNLEIRLDRWPCLCPSTWWDRAAMLIIWPEGNGHKAPTDLPSAERSEVHTHMLLADSSSQRNTHQFPLPHPASLSPLLPPSDSHTYQSKTTHPPILKYPYFVSGERVFCYHCCEIP